MSDLTIFNQSLTQSAISAQLTYMPTGRISSNINIYVRQNGDDNHTLTECQTNDDQHALASLSGAFNLLSKYTIDDNCYTTVNLNSGVFYCNSTIYLNHRDGGKIDIIGYTSASTASAMTSANTTTLDWTGTNVDGLKIEKNCVINSIANLYLVGGTSGSKNTRFALYVNANSSLYLLINFKCNYWYGGLNINANSSCNLSGSIYVDSNTTFGIGSTNISRILNYADSIISNNNTNGLIITNNSLWYSNSSSNPIIMSNCASGILVDTNSYAKFYNIYAVDNNGYGIYANNASNINMTSAIMKTYGPYGSFYSNTNSTITGISGSLSGVNCIYAVNNSYILSQNTTLSASTNAIYAAYNSYVRGVSNTIVSGTISPAHNVVGNFNSYTLSA